MCILVLKPQQLPAIRTEGGGLGSPPSLLEGLCTFGKWSPLLGLSDLTKHIGDSVKGEIEEGGGCVEDNELTSYTFCLPVSGGIQVLTAKNSELEGGLGVRVAGEAVSVK